MKRRTLTMVWHALAGMLLGLGLTTQTQAITNFFTDGFETYSLGTLPTGSKWILVNNNTIVVTNDMASSGSQSLFMAGIPQAPPRQVIGSSFAAQAQVWVQLDVHLFTAASNENNGAVIDLLPAAGGIPADLRLVPLVNGTYNVGVLKNGGTTTYTNLPVEASGVFRTYTFGITITGTNATTGTGVYSLYLGTNALATDVPFTSFSASTTNMNHLNLFGDAAWNVDQIRLFDSNPIPEPSSVTMLLLGLPVCASVLGRLRKRPATV